MSVDCVDSSSGSVESSRRQRDLAELFEQTRVPSNWMLGTLAPDLRPGKVEMTVPIPHTLLRGELLTHLRETKARLSPYGQSVATVAADPYQAKCMWDLLVRQGCLVVRPRSTEVVQDDQFTSIRAGLWMAPLCCSFIGGSRSSVRSLLKICRRKLVDAARNRRLFHVSIETGNARESWAEEMEALRILLLTAYEEKAKGNIEFALLSELPQLLARQQSGKPMQSILRAA